MKNKNQPTQIYNSKKENKMKIVLIKMLLLFISASMAACATPVKMRKPLITEKPCNRVNGICACPVNTKRNPTSFIVVVLDDKNRPVSALTPTSKVKNLIIVLLC